MAPGIRLKARWRLMRAMMKTLLWLLAVVVLALLLVLKTGPGHRLVLAWALDQARSRVDGQIEVAAIRSSNLLRGTRLVDVRLTTPDGEAFLSADSIEASYRLLSLVRGNLSLSNVRVWSPTLRLVRYPDEERGTLRRWLGEPRGPGGPTQTLLFDDVRVIDGAVVMIDPLLTPDDTLGLLRWRDTPRGMVQDLEVTSLDASVPRLSVLEGDAVVEATLGSARARFDLLEEPLTLEDAAVDVRLANDTLALGIGRATVDGIDTRGEATVIWPPVDDVDGEDAGVDGREGPTLTLDVRVAELDLARYRWLAEGLPALVGAARLEATVGPGVQRFRVSELDGMLDGGSVRGRATLVRNGRTRVDDVDLTFGGVPLEVVAPYLPEGDTLPIRGRVAGNLRADGPLSSPSVAGTFRLSPEAHPPASGRFDGTVLLPEGGPVGVAGFTLVLDTLDWSLAGDVFPAVRITGPGRAEVTATGDLQEGLRFDADLEHMPSGAPTSHVLATGSVRAQGNTYAMDIQADVSPLSLTAWRVAYPDLPLSGEMHGAVRARGTLDDLEIDAQVQTDVGRLDLMARLNALDVGAGYQIEGEVDDFLASELMPSLPDPTRLSGWLSAEGSGLEASDIVLDVRTELAGSHVAGLDIDSLRATARVGDGVLTLDTLTALAGGFTVDAQGTLAVDTARAPGEMRLNFATASLAGLRPLLMGENVIAADTLGALDLELLRVSGVDPDTLPSSEEVQMEGSARGALTLTGALSDFAAEGEIDIEGLRYGLNYADTVRVTGSAGGLPGTAGPADLEVESGAAEFLGRSFAGARAEVDFENGAGDLALEVWRNDDEDYRARARFEIDTLESRVEVDELNLRFDTLAYDLAGPARLVWNDSSVTVQAFELQRPGAVPFSLRAEGVLPRRGQADFRVAGDGVQLERFLQLAQIEDFDLAGLAGFDVQIEGTASEPLIEGSFTARDLRLETANMSRVEGEFSHRDRSVEVALTGWRDDLRTLEVTGSLPFDLALEDVEDRTPEGDMDLTLRADSLPAVFVLSLLEDLDDVEGTFSGEVHLGGDLAEVQPEGTLRLRAGAWTVGALGVRQSSVEATLGVATDRVVTVEATGRAGEGTVAVSGTVTPSPLADPGLDLAIRLNRFLAVDRRDVEGAVSGEVQLTQRFRRPVISGDLRVDEGILHLEEFQRSAGVVDLSDPRFFTYLDTALLRGRPLLAETRNPFMDSLRVSVNLDVARDTWLRSPKMNVEIGGNLIVTYDRAAQDIVLIGELEAIRGQYTFLNRAFEVRSGQVLFVGTPGINPNLDIEAVVRIRRREAESLDITAHLTGTLVDPRVGLSTDQVAVPESDLISYLAFGRPSSDFNSLVASDQAGGDGLIGEGASYVASTLASTLASLAQGVGWFDYLSVSQSAEGGGTSRGLAPFAGTEIEIGQYLLGGDYFAALTLRPLSGSGRSRLVGGFRLEWQASDQYHVEAFVEDRFLRGGGVGFEELGLESSRIYGFTFFREWGY